MELLRIQILLSNDMCMLHQARMRSFAQEKAEVDIIINSYSSILQKINEKFEKNNFENLKKYIIKYLNKENNV